MASSDTELLTEHFGYPPVSLLDDIINSVNILAERAVSSVEQALLRQPPASLGFKAAKKASRPEDRAAAEAAAAEAHRHEVENGTHQLETLLCASIDRNFDKFELYVMRNILCVQPEDRDWIRLAHYEGLDFGEVGGEGEGGERGEEQGKDLPPSDVAIARLHRRLQASLQLGSLLEAETARNDVMLAQLRVLAGVTTEAEAEAGAGADVAKSEPSPEPASHFGFLLDRGPLTESDVAAPLTTTTAFALSQLPALRQLSGTLRQMAPGLEDRSTSISAKADNEHDDPHDPKSWRRERLEYVEGATRKHLERTRGLGLGRHGELVQSNSQQTVGDLNSNSTLAVEPDALSNILSILREHRRPDETTDGEAMDQS
ncbi:mind kinetochore complex component [Grosmannia clavigera kw1407]|uniref:Mind kinetochore complex component n=1 Tax=Grosmannia clavigera (strain kw1407 / UAMH 11150) TaxID=655863 RepID=F0XGZ7_GROCL|nr:mind kinetochore complex component [Grosmannia clavigera kw1407]EFX03117.1 mind kinetochore complex component [Grosmannia clavigera kw1407]